MTKTAKTAAPLNNCACSEFEIGFTVELEDGTPEWRGMGTGCTATTRRVFSPGSDAKLKSLLIKAGIAGMEVRQLTGGVLHSGDAVVMAGQFGFAYMVKTGIERGLAKAAAPKKERKAAAPKKDKKSADERAAALTAKMAEVAGKVTVASTPEVAAQVAAKLASEDEAWAGEATPAEIVGVVRVKIGRWEYDAMIAPNGDANYTDGKGVARVAVEGNYKLA